MKKIYIRKISLILMLAILVNIFSISATAAGYVTGANSVSASYSTDRYYKNFKAIELTGDGRTDVLAIALSQLGYQEGDTATQYGGTSSGSGNYTEYNYNMGDFGAGYGGSQYPWCASFASFCLLQARCHNLNRISDWCRSHVGDSRYIWREVSCSQWAKQLRTCGYFQNSSYFGGSYTPVSGDLIFFTSNGSTESHIGFVLYAESDKVYTIEGNTSTAATLETNGGGVYFKSYSKSSTKIRGYGVLPYKSVSSVKRPDYSGERLSAGLYIATTNKYVYATENASSYTWLLPKYSMFKVSEVASNGRVKASCRINGEVVTGYIKNNSDRILQLTASSNSQSIHHITDIWEYNNFHIDYYYRNSDRSPAKPQTLNVSSGEKLRIEGWMGFTEPFVEAGYFFDDNTDKIFWDTDALGQYTEPAVLVAGGKYAERFYITAETQRINEGKHTVSFVVRLKDGTVAIIETLSFESSIDITLDELVELRKALINKNAFSLPDRNGDNFTDIRDLVFIKKIFVGII